MSITEEDLVQGAPDPNSDGMVELLGNMLQQMLGQVPFTFSYGDVMGAALYLVVDSGLVNAPTPEKLREDIVDGLDRILAERSAEKRRLN